SFKSMAEPKHRILKVENHIYYLSQCLLNLGHKVVVMTHAYVNRSGVRYMTGGLKVYYVPWRPFVMQTTFPTVYDIDQAICVSHMSKENTVLRSGLAPGKVFMIPNAVDIAMFKPASVRPSADVVRIVVISRLVYRKGADLLVGGLTTIKLLISRKKETTRVSNLFDLHHMLVKDATVR
ncbi:hypothetical protein F2Q69_00018279, partial [Brassica cretica]